MKFKPGDHILICSNLKVAKVVSVRLKGSVITLWVKSKDDEFPLTAFKDSSDFIVSYSYDAKSKFESKVYKLTSILNVIGIIALGCIIYNFI